MPKTKLTDALMFGTLFLLFLQVLSDFIQSIYAFGLLVTAFTAEVAAILLLFTPLLLVIFRRPLLRPALMALAVIAVAARLVESMLGPGGRLVACGVSVGAFLLLLPLLLARRPHNGWAAASGLALAVSLSVLFRTAGSGLDLSETGMFQIIGLGLGLLAFYLVLRADLSTDAEDASSAAGRGVLVSALGLISVLLLLYYAFLSPTVMARWTGISLAPILGALAAALVVFALLARAGGPLARVSRPVLIVWNALFILLLVLAILPHQVSLPPVRELYPIDPPEASPLAALSLVLMLLASPVLFLDFRLFAAQIAGARPSMRQLGGGFAAAALFLLVMVFLHVFTTIYDYAPVVGPLFRDRFWLVHLLAGLGVFLPLLAARREALPAEGSGMPAALVWVMTSLALLTGAAYLLTRADPSLPPASAELRVMTYNIQQGFDKAGNQNLEGQLAVIRSIGPDILGLQESDTARLANGNADAVRYMADRLDMYSYYGPTTTTGTFGIALLSRYPLEDPRTFFMYSEGEQTAAIHAAVMVSGRRFNIFVTHLGNRGPMPQLEDLLTRTSGLENVIAMGDFNFRPDTDQYALITGGLRDSWLLKWPQGRDIPGYSAERRIDHIFISPGLTVLDSKYALDAASDHPYMFTVIAP